MYLLWNSPFIHFSDIVGGSCFFVQNVGKDPQWYAVKGGEPLVSGQATTLPDCVKQTGMMVREILLVKKM